MPTFRNCTGSLVSIYGVIGDNTTIPVLIVDKIPGHCAEKTTIPYIQYEFVVCDNETKLCDSNHSYAKTPDRGPVYILDNYYGTGRNVDLSDEDFANGTYLSNKVKVTKAEPGIFYMSIPSNHESLNTTKPTKPDEASNWRYIFAIPMLLFIIIIIIAAIISVLIYMNWDKIIEMLT
jgi:hypothetical protein